MSALPGKLEHQFMKALSPALFLFQILPVVARLRTWMVKGTGISLRCTEYWKEASNPTVANHSLTMEIGSARFLGDFESTDFSLSDIAAVFFTPAKRTIARSVMDTAFELRDMRMLPALIRFEFRQIGSSPMPS